MMTAVFIPCRPDGRNPVRRVLLVCALCLGTATGCGEQSAPGEAADAQPASPQQGEPAKLTTVALGEIFVDQARPLENSTLHVRFKAHAVAAGANGKRLEKLLKVLHHQARERVIIAVRTAETWEFDETELTKLRRRILLALNRWLREPLVEEVIVTEFRFRVD